MCSYWRVVLTTHCLCTSHLFRWLLQINYYGSYLSILLLQKPSVKTLPSFSWTLTPHQVQHTCKWGKNRISKLMKRRSIQHGYKYSVFCSFLFLPTHLCSLWSVLLSYTPNPQNVLPTSGMLPCHWETSLTCKYAQFCTVCNVRLKHSLNFTFVKLIHLMFWDKPYRFLQPLHTPLNFKAFFSPTVET